MTFEELIKLLPACPGRNVLALKNDTGGVRYQGMGMPGFVGADLIPSKEIEQPARPKVIIISAAGAVGKSTLAQELAYRNAAPLFDLSQASAVGNNSMTGQLTASFGFAAAAQISSGIAQGTLFIVVDALDEARVKANEAGFEAFVRDIAEIAKTATSVAFVLLGRTQAADHTWLLLQEFGIDAALLSIQPFTREQAEEYIELRIRNYDAAASRNIETHLQPFLEARNLILDHLKKAVVGETILTDSAVREFLGYAPVLETVAVLLAKEGNYQEFSESLKLISSTPKNESHRPLVVLERVISRLLEREQKQKLQTNIRPALEGVANQEGWSAWESLYSPEEQVTRLLGIALGRKINAGPDMPSAVRSLYEEQLATWLPEHPFLRDGRFPANKVFESYLFAIALRDYLTDICKIVESRIATKEYKPSRLLADFYVLFGEKFGRDEVAECQIGILYDSLLAGETDTLKIRLNIEAGTPDEEDDEESIGEGDFELVYAASASQQSERIELRAFKIVNQKGIIAFRRQLKEAYIVTRGTVLLGGHADEFELGPLVDISCRQLEFNSTGLIVRGSIIKQRESDGVVLYAGICESKLARRPEVRGAFTVTWPGAESYPWTEFSVPSQGDELDNDQMHEVHRRFRRIVGSLRSHSKGSLARFKDKIEHRRVLKNEVGKALLKSLVDDGILKLIGEFYHWIPAQADDKLKLSWNDLRNRRVTPQMKEYFSDFIAKNKSLF